VPVESNDFLAGETGVLKTAMAALFQSFYGPRFTADTLPGTWLSTPNGLERLAWLVKDAVFTVDEFVPRGTSLQKLRKHEDADRLMRGSANTQGRQRLRSSTSVDFEAAINAMKGHAMIGPPSVFPDLAIRLLINETKRSFITSCSPSSTTA